MTRDSQRRWHLRWALEDGKMQHRGRRKGMASQGEGTAWAKAQRYDTPWDYRGREELSIPALIIRPTLLILYLAVWVFGGLAFLSRQRKRYWKRVNFRGQNKVTWWAQLKVSSVSCPTHTQQGNSHWGWYFPEPFCAVRPTSLTPLGFSSGSQCLPAEIHVAKCSRKKTKPSEVTCNFYADFKLFQNNIKKQNKAGLRVYRWNPVGKYW